MREREKGEEEEDGKVKDKENVMEEEQHEALTTEFSMALNQLLL